MKKITKIIAALAAVAVLVMSFAGCGLLKDYDEVEAVKQLDKTVLKLAEEIEVDGGYYGWYFSSVHNEKLSEKQQAEELAAQIESSVDSAADSSADSAADVEIPEIKLDDVKAEAEKRIVTVKMASQKAIEDGFVLSNKDYKNIEAQVDSIKSQITQSISAAGINYNDYLKLMNTDAESLEAVVTDQYIANVYYASLVEDKYVTAKHILIEASEEKRTKDEAKKLIDEIKAQLDDGADFDKLMKEKCEDPGLETNPNGYTFTKGQMVAEFEEAAYALEVGQVSAPVETDYGYHILKKCETDKSDVAAALFSVSDQEIADLIKAEGEKLSEGVEVAETGAIKFYTVD